MIFQDVGALAVLAMFVYVVRRIKTECHKWEKTMFEVNKFQTSSLRFVTEYHMLQFKSMAVPNGGSIMLHFKPKN